MELTFLKCFLHRMTQSNIMFLNCAIAKNEILLENHDFMSKNVKILHFEIIFFSLISVFAIKIIRKKNWNDYHDK